MRLVIDMQSAQTASRLRGAGRMCIAVSMAMSRLAQGRGHEVILLVSDRFPDAIPQLIEQFRGLVAPEQFRTFHVPPGEVRDTVPENLERLRVAEALREDFIAALEPDFVHIHNLFEGSGDDAVVSIGRGRKQSPTAVTFLDIIPLVMQDVYITTDSFRQHYFRKLESLAQADLLLAISEHSKRDAIERLGVAPGKIVTIPLATDGKFSPASYDGERADHLKRRLNITQPFVLYVPGGFDPRKNFSNLLAGFAALPESIRESHQLVIASKPRPSDIETLTAEARTLGLRPDTLVLTGHIDDGDLLGLYTLAIVHVFPSLYEGFGLPALESMACGTPTIGSNTSSLPEIVGRPDATFDPASPASIAEKLQQVIGDAAFRDTLREHAVAHAKTFSWEESARIALDAIERAHEERIRAGAGQAH